jgi:ABC-type multidrug transport system permease subunit
LDYLSIKKALSDQKNIVVSNTVQSVLQEIRKKNEVQWLWKWFLLLSIVSLFFEILILKFFKP